MGGYFPTGATEKDVRAAFNKYAEAGHKYMLVIDRCDVNGGWETQVNRSTNAVDSLPKIIPLLRKLKADAGYPCDFKLQEIFDLSKEYDEQKTRARWGIELLLPPALRDCFEHGYLKPGC